MRVLLTVNDVKFEIGSSVAGAWWRLRPRLIGTFWRCLSINGLLDDFRYYARPGARRGTRLTSLEALAADSVTWQDGTGWLSSTASRSNDCYLRFGIGDDELSFRIGFGDEYLDRRRRTILDQFVEAVRCLHTAMRAEALFGPALKVSVSDLPYPRPRPPRLHKHFGHGDLVDFFCLDFQHQHHLGHPEEIERLLSAPLPEGASRQDDDDLVILRWIDSLEDEAEVARRLSIQDQWLTNILQPPLAPWFDERGDLQVQTLPPPRDSLLTYYAPDSGNGYLEVADDWAGEARLDEVLGWLADRRLPDGRPLNGLYVIAPDRETAVRLHDRTRRDGPTAIYYPKPDGYWWDPFPPGPWIEEDQRR